jgi:hypothetical protein
MAAQTENGLSSTSLNVATLVGITVATRIRKQTIE